jgi:hypothetical protein
MTEGISPTETSGTDPEAVKRSRPRSTRSWSRPAAGARGGGHRQQLPMDADSRARGGDQQLGLHASLPSVMRRHENRPARGPSRRPRPPPSFTVDSPSSLTPATRRTGCSGRPAGSDPFSGASPRSPGRGNWGVATAGCMLDQGEEESRVGNRGVVGAARIDERRNGQWGTAEGGTGAS